MVGIGVIGYGYWGPNLVRNFFQVDGARVQMVSDLDRARLDLVASRYPSVRLTSDAGELIADPDVDAVCVATPVGSHYELALAALKAGKHVLVEKPMAATTEQAEHLREEAAGRGLVLMVDHTFCYMGAVRRIKEIIDSGDLGEVYYYDSTRVNLGLFQPDVNVIWDLAVHDLSLIHHLLPFTPTAVTCTGKAHVAGHPENMASLTLHFDANAIAHVNVNWLSPVKLRQVLIGGSRKMIVFDDLHSSEKIRIYDRGITVEADQEDAYQTMVGYRTGDMWAPQYDQAEALQVEAAHFLDCVNGRAEPLTGADMGADLVRILEAADRSMRDNGALVPLERRA